MRKLQLNIRLDEVESERFNRVAAVYEMNVAQVIRYLMREEAKRLGVVPTQRDERRERR